MSSFNNWNVSYSTITWFESYLVGHKNVESFERREDIVFDIHRKYQKDTVSVLLTTDYVFGAAHFYKALSDFQNINAIVLAGNWNKYTSDAHEVSREARVPLFTTKEFYAALFKPKVSDHAH